MEHGFTHLLTALAASPDGNELAVSGWTGWGRKWSQSIYIIDISTGNIKKRIGFVPMVTNVLAYSDNGKYLAAGFGGKKGIAIYQTRNFKQAFSDTGYDSSTSSFDFDSAGNFITATANGVLRLYDKHFHLIKKHLMYDGIAIISSIFSPDGNLIALGYQNKTQVDILDAKTFDIKYRPYAKIHSPLLKEFAQLTGKKEFIDFRNLVWSADGNFLFGAGSAFQQSSKSTDDAMGIVGRSRYRGERPSPHYFMPRLIQ